MAHQLLLSQENDVFEAIQRAGFDPADFEWQRRDSRTHINERSPTLVHVPSENWFLFDYASGQHFATYTPGAEKPMDHLAAGGWKGEVGRVAQWLANLAREYYAPDLWAELAKARELTAAVGVPGPEDNRPFSLEEQASIAAQLSEIKELLVRTERLEGEKLRAIEAGIEYLTDAATRMGRKDYLVIFYGTLFSWGLGAFVSPDGLRQAIMLAARGLGHLFGGDPPQLGP